MIKEIKDKISEKHNFNSMFYKILLIINVIIIFSISAVTLFSYSRSSKALLDEVENRNKLLLSQTEDIVDQYITYANNITLQIGREIDGSDLLYYSRDITLKDFDKIYNTQKKIIQITQSNDYIGGIWIYLLNSDKVISDKYSFTTLNSYIQTRYEASYNDPNYWKEIFDKSNDFKSLGILNLRPQENAQQVVSFIRTYPIGIKDKDVIVIIELKERAIKDYLKNYNKDTKMNTLVFDNNDNLITCEGNISSISEENAHEMISLFSDVDKNKNFIQKKYNGEYVASMMSSKNTGWKYISVISEKEILRETKDIRNINIIIAIIAIFLGFIFSVLLANKIYEPIRKILNYIGMINDSGVDKSENEFEYINRFIDYVYSENKNLTDNLNRSMPLLKRKCLLELLSGKISVDIFNSYEEFLHILFKYEGFQIAILSIENYLNENAKSPEEYEGNMERINYLIDSIVQKYIDKEMNIEYTNKEMNKIIFVFNISPDFKKTENIYHFLKEMINCINKNLKLNVYVSTGRYHVSKDEVVQAYSEAKSALKYKETKPYNQIIDIHDLNKIIVKNVEYSIETEKKLINFIKAADIDNINHTLEKIYIKNDLKTISEEKSNWLFSALIGTYIRIINEMQIPTNEIGKSLDEIFRALDGKDVSYKKEYINDLNNFILQYIDENKTSQYDKLFNNIVEYIDNHYMEDISLKGIGDYFGLSLSYISWIFSEVSNTNFLDYVNRKRVQKAVELLKDTCNKNINIKSIGEQVGFNNSNTFIRVFKKYQGITPGQFKKLNQ